MILANQHDAVETEWPYHLRDMGIEVVREAMVKQWTWNGTTLDYPIDIEVGDSLGKGKMTKV
jgi:hypothetical protein